VAAASISASRRGASTSLSSLDALFSASAPDAAENVMLSSPASNRTFGPSSCAYRCVLGGGRRTYRYRERRDRTARQAFQPHHEERQLGVHHQRVQRRQRRCALEAAPQRPPISFEHERRTGEQHLVPAQPHQRLRDGRRRRSIEAEQPEDLRPQLGAERQPELGVVDSCRDTIEERALLVRRHRGRGAGDADRARGPIEIHAAAAESFEEGGRQAGPADRQPDVRALRDGSPHETM